MNFLLDTHVFIWAISNNKNLSADVKTVIENSDNIIYISALTFWEIALKVSTGKLESIGISPQHLPEVALEAGYEIISLSPLECATYHQLEDKWHKDPFDRMLIWQAIKNNYIFISKDERVKQYVSAGLRVLW